jgi:hypothetical protein
MVKTKEEEETMSSKEAPEWETGSRLGEREREREREWVCWWQTRTCHADLYHRFLRRIYWHFNL